jgi:hypothetical protein
VIKPKETGIACEKCGKPMVIKGRGAGRSSRAQASRSAATRRPCRRAARKAPGNRREVREVRRADGLKRSRWGRSSSPARATRTARTRGNVGVARGRSRPGRGVRER